MAETSVEHTAGVDNTMRGHGDVREFPASVWRGVPDLAFEMVEGPFLHMRRSGEGHGG